MELRDKNKEFWAKLKLWEKCYFFGLAYTAFAVGLYFGMTISPKSTFSAVFFILSCPGPLVFWGVVGLLAMLDNSDKGL